MAFKRHMGSRPIQGAAVALRWARVDGKYTKPRIEISLGSDLLDAYEIGIGKRVDLLFGDDVDSGSALVAKADCGQYIVGNPGKGAIFGIVGTTAIPDWLTVPELGASIFKTPADAEIIPTPADARHVAKTCIHVTFPPEFIREDD